MTVDQTAQPRYRCTVDWGRAAIEPAVDRRDIVVIVDTLRFSTAAAAAIRHGAVIYPSPDADEAYSLAQRVGGVVASMGSPSGFTLSPASYETVKRGTRIVLPSPNGAACTRYAAGAPYVFVAALVNASAAAAAITTTLKGSEAGVTVVACGERRPESPADDSLRFAVEDYLGAGAIVARLACSKSPEAHLCEAAFLGVESEIEQLIWDCASGWELRQKGLGDDVAYASRLDRHAGLPVLQGDRLEKFGSVDAAGTS